MIDHYRQDVHQLQPPSKAGAIEAIRGGIPIPLPPTLEGFLSRWNGAILFRGALRIRSTSELAAAAENVRNVIVFADGPAQDDRWAFATDGHGQVVVGKWHESDNTGDLGQFEPLHDRFDRWLMSTVKILDENHREAASKLKTRLEADPDSGYLLLALAEQVLHQGDPTQARTLLERATARDPALAPAWERLGDTMIGHEDDKARFAYLKALRGIRLPAPFPSSSPPTPQLIRTLARLFPRGDDGWERELRCFMDESVQDALTEIEAGLVEAAAVALAQVLLDRGDRPGAREALVAHIDRARAFQVGILPIEAVLVLAEVEIELGLHDEAERRLRLLRNEEGVIHARTQLLLGWIAASRQEPWAEQILTEAIEGLEPRSVMGPDPHIAMRFRGLVMLAERRLLLGQLQTSKELSAQARVLADRLADEALHARLDLLEGDQCRQADDIPGAESAWRSAQQREHGCSQLKVRLLLRRGDLFRLTGDTQRAAEDYLQATQDFQALHLPTREGWAHLRLAQLGRRESIEQARTLFKAADLAAGVAATDAIAGNPAQCLEWHLERSGEHARDRANAQRARPPLTRADADRPERRMGAHRIAISACGSQIVQTLDKWLESCSRSLDLATPRVTDPNLARYIAAADLLAAHQSYEASEIMLRQLLELRPKGMAGQALVGAMARSPNAALVDGLLEALEGGFDPSGMAAAAEVLGLRRESMAVPILRKLAGPSSTLRVRRAAITALGRIGEHAAIDELVQALEEPGLAEETSVSLLLLGEWQGVDAQAQALASRKEPISQSLGEIVGRYGGPAYMLLLFRTAELDGPAGIGAIHGLGYLGEARAVQRLIDALASRDITRCQMANASLEIITGHHEDPEESLLRNRWIDWWEKNGCNFQEGTRYRHGEQMDPGTLLSRLEHDDSLVRRSAYDELVISTGEHLPFDAEGPYRVQVSHIQTWKRWWKSQDPERFPPGNWWFHGESIG
jgi:HEAT repeat protein